MEYVLKTSGLTKSYGINNAVDNVDMNIPIGAIYGFVGQNGSGKTTLIRIITGLINQNKGSFELYGAKTKQELRSARRKIAAVVETPSIYLNMTAFENLSLQCKLLDVDVNEIDRILHLVNLAYTGNKKARNFSLGMKQRLGIAVALIGRPDFLILDEPTNGLDPEGIVEIRELLLKLNREQNITILVSSHILTELSKIATHYGFISKGKLVKEITAEDLSNWCRKRNRLTLSSVEGIESVLSQFVGITEYDIKSDTTVELFGEFNVTDLVIALSKIKINVNKLSEHNEDLESFYINLVGGLRNA